MDFEHSRALGALATAESEARRRTEEIDGLRRALVAMNAVSDHQTNRVSPSVLVGDVVVRTRVHPLTCGRDSRHGILFPRWDGTRVLLRCPDCDYEQVAWPRIGADVPA